MSNDDDPFNRMPLGGQGRAGLGISRVQGLGLRVQGLGFRVEGLGFRVEGLGFRV